MIPIVNLKIFYYAPKATPFRIVVIRHTYTCTILVMEISLQWRDQQVLSRWTHPFYFGPDIESNICKCIFRIPIFDPASTSVKDLQKFNFDILCYPNPSMKILNIQSVKEILAEGVLHDALGNVFYRFQINGNRSSIPVSEIPSGEYFITLYNTTHYFSKPIIVQH